jgi:hypothetical protein
MGERGTVVGWDTVLRSRVSVTKDGVRIGNWIHWPLTGPNYS